MVTLELQLDDLGVKFVCKNEGEKNKSVRRMWIEINFNTIV